MLCGGGGGGGGEGVDEKVLSALSFLFLLVSG